MAVHWELPLPRSYGAQSKAVAVAVTAATAKATSTSAIARGAGGTVFAILRVLMTPHLPRDNY